MSQNQWMQQIAAANAQARRALGQADAASANVAAMRGDINAAMQGVAQLKAVMERLQIGRTGDPSIQYVENIPGRRVPFDYLVDIPIQAGVTSVQQQTITISQEGPFVCVARYATLLSQFQFQRTDPTSGATSTFNGRSYGRYRPVHSAWDLNDGGFLNQVVLTTSPTFPGTGEPQFISPGNESSFRTMEGDFRIKVINAGSSYPRSNQEVPSSFWTTEINSPFNLGALDVFERGEVITFQVLPLHANNPAFGNISAFAKTNNAFPFLDSQFDAREGIDDHEDTNAQDTDPVVRLPNAILTIGFHGYRIIQPAGAGPY